MQTNDMAEKKVILYDGIEIPGLVNWGEIALERQQLEVPEFSRIRRISNGITTIPAIEITYKHARDSETLEFFRAYYLEHQVKEITVIRVDAAGIEFARTLLPFCEMVRYTEPAFDAANPTYAQIAGIILPWDVIPISAV